MRPIPEAWRPPAAAPPQGILRLAVPTGLPVGDVNAWLLPDPWTLVDPGPRTPEARRALERGLAAAGLALRDVERVLLTHHHPDHAGLAADVRAAAGCDVWALGEDARLVRDWEREAPRRHDEYGEGLRLAGVPSELLAALDREGRELDTLMQGCTAVRDISSAGRLEAAGRSFTLVPAAGHTEGSFLLVADDVVLTGDTLLPHITPNAIHVRRAEWGALSRYVATLRTLQGMDWEGRVALPGHGTSFGDVAGVVTRGLAHHEARAGRVALLLADGARTVWDVASGLFPMEGRHGAFLAVSEAFGHLELLAERGQARRRDDRGVLRYEPTR